MFVFLFNYMYSLGPLALVDENCLLGGMGENIAKET